MTTTTLSRVQVIAQKFTAIRDFQERKVGLIGRRIEMHIVMIAIVARLHVLLYGTPGVAKSMTVDGILRHLPELSQFKTQAYKASAPEQFLGPISLKRMAEDEYVRIIDRRAPDVEIFYCDEISRAPRAVLPSFQGMMVEREFDAGNGVQPIPLMSVIGTLNHVPDDPELEAFFDRFALKLTVRPPASQAQFVEILKGALNRRRDGYPEIPDELIVSHDELNEIQAFADQVHVPEAILDTFGEMWSNLLGVGIVPSVRRYTDVTSAMQAAAALDGRDEATIDDLQIAQHSLWTAPEEAETVRAEVVNFASDWIKTKAELLDSFTETLDRLGQVQALVAAGTDTSARVVIKDIHGDPITDAEGHNPSITEHGIKVVNGQRELRKLIEKHVAEATGQDVSELEAVLTQMDGASAWVSDRLLGGLTL